MNQFFPVFPSRKRQKIKSLSKSFLRKQTHLGFNQNLGTVSDETLNEWITCIKGLSFIAGQEKGR